MTKIRNFIAWLLLIGGFVGGFYFGAYKMLYEPIIYACIYHDIGGLTSTIIAKTIFTCLCSLPVWCLWSFAGLMAFSIVSEYD